LFFISKDLKMTSLFHLILCNIETLLLSLNFNKKMILFIFNTIMNVICGVACKEIQFVTVIIKKIIIKSIDDTMHVIDKIYFPLWS